MSHTSHATAYLLTWSQVGAFVCRRGRWHERREPVAWSTIVMQLRVFQHARNCMCSNLVAASAFVLSDEERDSCMPHTSHTIACLLTCLQLGSLFCRMRRGASCMSHTSHATACLLTWLQLRPLSCRREWREERGRRCMSHTSPAIACLLTWSQLGAFTLSKEERRQLHVPH